MSKNDKNIKIFIDTLEEVTTNHNNISQTLCEVETWKYCEENLKLINELILSILEDFFFDKSLSSQQNLFINK